MRFHIALKLVKVPQLWVMKGSYFGLPAVPLFRNATGMAVALMAWARHRCLQLYFIFCSLYLIFYSFHFMYISSVLYSIIFALSMERTWLTFHCWLYTLCIIVYVTNKSWTWTYLLNDSQMIRSTINFSKPLLCVMLICGDWFDWSISFKAVFVSAVLLCVQPSPGKQLF